MREGKGEEKGGRERHRGEREIEKETPILPNILLKSELASRLRIGGLNHK